MAWISFGGFALQEKIFDDSSRLDIAEIARVPDMLPSLFPSWSGYGLISTPVLSKSKQRIKLNVFLEPPLWSSSVFSNYDAGKFTYLLTPWSIVLEKLTGPQLVKKFPVFYGTRKFITSFTSSSHLSLFSAKLIQSMPPHPTSWRSILILSSHQRMGLPSGIFPSGFPTKTLHTPLLSLISATWPALLTLLNLIARKTQCWCCKHASSNKEYFVLHNTVEHNYISSSSTLGLQLHVSTLYVGHLQVVTWLSVQLYKMCWVFF